VAFESQKEKKAHLLWRLMEILLTVNKITKARSGLELILLSSVCEDFVTTSSFVIFNPECDLFEFNKTRSVHRYIKHEKWKIPSKVFEIAMFGITYNIPKTNR
jgi:hypothetical protein